MKCTHCRLDFNEGQMLVSGGKHFCCKGCQAVYELIQSKDLGDFYERLGKNTLEPVDFKNFAEFFAKFGVFGVEFWIKFRQNPNFLIPSKAKYPKSTQQKQISKKSSKFCHIEALKKPKYH